MEQLPQKYKLDILLTWKLSGKQSKQHQIPHLKQESQRDLLHLISSSYFKPQSHCLRFRFAFFNALRTLFCSFSSSSFFLVSSLSLFFISESISFCLFAAASASNRFVAASLVRQDANWKIKSKRTCSCWTVNIGGRPFLSDFVMPQRCVITVPELTE